MAQISAILRIRKEMVEAIEHGRHDLLPGHAYEIGFVRSYADYLRLDTPDVVRRYKAELAAEQSSGQFNLQVPEEEQRFNFVSVGVILLCLAAAGAGAWYLAKQQGWLDGNRPLGPTVTETESPASTTPRPDTVEPAPAPPAPVSTAPVVAAPPSPPVVEAPAPRPGGIVPAAPGEQPTPATGKEMGKTNADARIVFIARRAAFLTIGGSDSRQPYINRTLALGDSYRVPNKRNLVMQLSDAGALDVMLDGAFIGRAGADGAALKDFALSPEVYGAAATPPASAAPASPQPEAGPAEPAPVPATPPAGATPD
ncbi:MAG: helix-turn-helix domain-containing protein [Alphaproteobacteria bacterium]|nr:helix-turn-helix domain-containing protein [Alphaproteobacteria bacterium]